MWISIVNNIVNNIVIFISAFVASVIGAIASYYFLSRQYKKEKKYQEGIVLKIIKVKLFSLKEAIERYKASITLCKEHPNIKLEKALDLNSIEKIIKNDNPKINLDNIKDNEIFEYLNKYNINLNKFYDEYFIPSEYYKDITNEKMDKLLCKLIPYNECLSDLNLAILNRQQHIFGSQMNINSSHSNFTSALQNRENFLNFMIILFNVNKKCLKSMESMLIVIKEIEKTIKV
ncbi:hypothetical protein [Francisella philomiragia]|uniref:Uncharacterized protein n=1 Tax=Francisella philomiragia TaxID=28110 RepID=A0A0B6CWI4_9GAMM|nr:hypothetical protein [Francisella philomiragia]AJI53220.1 hypothetical protein LA55_11 [Francisella philomiragia]